MLRVLLAVPATAAALAAGALPAAARRPVAPPGPGPGDGHAKDIAFNPAKVTIRRGGTVTFRWADGDSPHNVIAAAARPARPRLATRKAGSAAVRLTRRGTYRFICTIHPGMAGRIVVPDQAPTERMGMSHISLEQIDHTGALREMADERRRDRRRRHAARRCCAEAGMAGAGFVAGGVLFNGMLSPAQAAGITLEPRRVERPTTSRSPTTR